MAKVWVKRKDVLLGLDGVVYIEGKYAKNLVASIKKNKRNGLRLLRTVAPKLKGKDISIDKFGRVKIDNPRIAQVAQILLAETDISKIGADIAKKPVPVPSYNEHDNEVDMFCAGKLPGGDGDMDIICGRWDSDKPDPCNFNFACGWKSHKK